jgi:hypothetical protein
MRKFLLVAYLALSTFFADAQIKKGSVLLGGSIGYTEYSSGSATWEPYSRTLFFSPAVGLAIKDNNVFGVKAITVFNKNIQSNSVEAKNSTRGGGLFFKRYLDLGKNFYLFGEAGANYIASKSEAVAAPGTGNKTGNKVFGISIFPGITYAVSRHFHLEASINDLLNIAYNHQTYLNYTPTMESAYENKSFGINVNANPTTAMNIGFRILLGK